MSLSRVIGYVKEYRDAIDHSGQLIVGMQGLRKPHETGVYKVNFDGVKLKDWGHGWRVAIPNRMGNLTTIGVHQREGFLGSELEEARACMYVLKEAL